MCCAWLWYPFTKLNIEGTHIPVPVSPGIDISLTEGEGCLVLESLQPGDQSPRSSWEEAVEEDVTTGAKATVWGMNEWRRGERTTPSLSPCASTNGRAVDISG